MLPIWISRWLHNNEQAIALYEKLGFRRVNVFAVKRKNEINEKLFVGEQTETELNPYAKIIVNEALRRGIHVEVNDAANGFFRLSHGGRSVRLPRISDRFDQRCGDVDL